MSIRILVVDDHVLVRKGFCSMLKNHDSSWEIFESDNGVQAILTASRVKPDIILMDYHMPKLDGAKATSQIMKAHPNAKVIMISAETHADNVIDMIQAGVKGVVSKDSDDEELLDAINSVKNGHHYFSSRNGASVQEDYIEELKEGTAGYLRTRKLLTERENEVAKMILDGYSNVELAENLSLSIKTIEQHKYNIFKKCGVKSTAEFVSAAYRNKWINP